MYARKHIASKSIGAPALTGAQNGLVSDVWILLDSKLPHFKSWYYISETSDDEDVISYRLVEFLNIQIRNLNNGYTPYCFQFQGPQPNTRRKIDMTVIIPDVEKPATSFLEIEAKRLYNNGNNEEYVYGHTGGIERFKRNLHAAHLSTGAIIGYVQSADNWFGKISGWLDSKKTDTSLNWSEDVNLKEVHKDDSIIKCESRSKRTNSNSDISIVHYLLSFVR